VRGCAKGMRGGNGDEEEKDVIKIERKRRYESGEAVLIDQSGVA
jgi:hypothetical protein